MKVGNQIQLSEYEGRCVISVNDAEVYDFVEDFITEKGLEFQVMFPTMNSMSHQLLIEQGISIETVYHLLSELNPAEIERIASINADHQSN